MATPLIYPPTQDGLQKTLSASLLTGVTASATLNNVTGIQNLKGLMVIDRVDANNVLTPNKREYITFSGTSGSTVVTLVRGLAGSTDQDHAVGAIVEFVNDIVQQQAVVDGLSLTVNADGTPRKAIGTDINTGTEDAEFVTPKAIADSNISFPTKTETLTNKRINSRIVSATSYTTDTGTSLDVSTCDTFIVTAQAGALKLNNPTGTPVQGQKLIVRIQDDGTARALTYDTYFRASSDLALPTTTVLGKSLYMGFIFDSTDTKWDLLAVLNNF
jgi:hypothetical protein